MRWAYHKDTAHKPVVTALRAIGATVQALHGKDVPDLLVGYRGQTFLLEVKTAGAETLDKRNGRTYRRTTQLSEGQREWAERWRGGPVAVVHTPEEAIAIVTAPPSTIEQRLVKAERERDEFKRIVRNA